jgi:transcription initiation factor TFIID subunit 12
VQNPELLQKQIALIDRHILQFQGQLPNEAIQGKINDLGKHRRIMEEQLNRLRSRRPSSSQGTSAPSRVTRQTTAAANTPTGPTNILQNDTLFANDNKHVLPKRKLEELLQQIDPRERFDSDVENILCALADEFVESVTSFACQIAKHRKSSTLEVKDLQLHLERNWNIRIPGFSADEDGKTLTKPVVTDAHKQRLMWIKRNRK